MTCSEIQAEFSLYLYGELDFATEELIEVHLLDCAFCQLALSREKQWHAAVNRQQQDVQPEWLSQCRQHLFDQVAGEPTTATQAAHKLAGLWRALIDFRLIDVRLNERSYRLAGMSFLLISGFAVGRVYNSFPMHFGNAASLNTAGLVQPALTQVQEIRPEAGDQVRIILHHVETREILGSRHDDGVRQLLMEAARQSVDPGVRLDSVEMLTGENSAEIRSAFVNTIRNDPNAAVRAKAIVALRKVPSDSTTRDALEFALAHDEDPGVRAEAIDGLIPAGGASEVTPQLIEMMSDVLHSPEADDYVRQRCAQVLKHQSLTNAIY